MSELLLFLWETPIVNTGAGEITLKALVFSAVILIAVILGLRGIRRAVMRRLSKRPKANLGPVNSVMMITSYIIIVLTITTIIHWSGINFSALTVIFGALSVGIGFGLQNIVNNFVSGIVILIERPIKLGDRIVVDGVEGNIVDIAIRASTLRTNEGVSVIVPNSHFIGSIVVNRSLDSETVRLKIHANASYDSDPRVVERVLLEVAAGHHGIHKDPEPVVIFEAFGESSLKFYLWVWTSEYAHRPDTIQSDINFAISAAFKANDIDVPLPQLDIFVKPPIAETPSAAPN